MNNPVHVTQLQVLHDGTTVGRLHAGPGRNDITFQYDPAWLAAGFDLAPHSLAFHAAPQTAASPLFHGLHGVFAASLPDGWGQLLMDREFKKRCNWNPGEIHPLDRLSYIGSRGMGALEYRPVIKSDIADQVDLNSMINSVDQLIAGEQSVVINQLRIQGGSPGGARPKVTVARSCSNSQILSGFHTLPPDYEHWIIKFRAQQDPADMGRIEMAYADMARDAGIEMPETELLAVPDLHGEPDYFFAVRRFDRQGNRKFHVIALDAILYADYRIPSLDYELVLGVTQRYTHTVLEVEKAFRLACFNSLAHNQDDHGKNFAMLYSDGQWKLAPGFDLTFSTGMGGEHTTSVAGDGKPGARSLLKLADAFSMDKSRAMAVLGQVSDAVGRWDHYADKFGVTTESSEAIAEALNALKKSFRE